MSELRDRIEDLIDDYLIEHQGRDAQLGYTDELANTILALLQKEQGWLPKLRTDWENAPRDRSPVLLKFKPAAQISWRLNWPRYIVGRHSGLPEGSDIDFNGWGMPGVGGWIDSDFEGFLPLPTPPQGEDG